MMPQESTETPLDWHIMRRRFPYIDSHMMQYKSVGFAIFQKFDLKGVHQSSIVVADKEHPYCPEFLR